MPNQSLKPTRFARGLALIRYAAGGSLVKRLGLARFWFYQIILLVVLAFAIGLTSQQRALVWAVVLVGAAMLVWLVAGRLRDLRMSLWWLAVFVPPNVLVRIPAVPTWLLVVSCLPAVPIMWLCLLRAGQTTRAAA